MEIALELGYFIHRSGGKNTCFDVKELYGAQTRTIGYYNIAAVQILIKWLGNSGVDIPIKISIRDLRILNKEKSILGLWSSNLYTGAVYTILALDHTISAMDKHIEDSLVLDIKAGIDLQPGSKSLSISVCTYSSWISESHPFRCRTGEFGLSELKVGKSIYLKPRDMDVMNVPQPIPIDELNYDLDFVFTDQTPLKPSVSSQVKYCVNSSQGLNIRLAKPKLVKTRSNRFPSISIKDTKDHDDSD